MPEKKLSIVMSGPEKSQPGKGGQGRHGAARANPNPEYLDLLKKTTFLGKVTQHKTHGHGDQPNPAQMMRRQFQYLPEPALHGFRRSNIRQSFEDQNKSYQSYQEFHGRALPESSVRCNTPQRC
jgi:hypothetical protein